MKEPTLTYTGKDQSTIKESLLNLVKTRFPNDWKEFAESSIGMAIVNVVAWAHAQRSFYQDMQAINSFLETANLPEAVISIAKQLGYRLRFSSSSSVPVSFFPSPAQPATIYIEKGSRILVDDLTFEAAQTYAIPAGKTSWPDETATEIPVFVEGETQSENFVSDGTTFQKFILASAGIADSTVSVVILEEEWKETLSLNFSDAFTTGRDAFTGTGEDYQTYKLTELGAIIDGSDVSLAVLVDGIRWKMVPEFTGAPEEYKAVQDTDGTTTILFSTEENLSSPGEGKMIDCLYQATGAQKMYTIEYDPDSRVAITFGDGESGIIPPDGSTITVSYRVGGGSRGNIRKGKLDGSVRGKLPSGTEVNVRVRNYESGSGGEDPETVEHAKVYAPRYAKSNERAVTKEDYATLASTYRDPIYGAASFASAKLKRDLPEENTIQITLWSRDAKGRPAKATSSLKEGVMHYLNKRKTECTRLEMLDGKVTFFDVSCSFTSKGGASASSIQEKATTALAGLFNSTYMQPGGIVSVSRILKVLQEIPELRTVVMDKIEGSYLTEIDLVNGDSVETVFSGVFQVPSGLSIVPGSFEITNGTLKINETQLGEFTGDVNLSGTNTIDKTSGKFTVTFSSPPAAGTFITAESRIYASMSSVETYNLAENRLNGITKSAPIIERFPVGIGDGKSISTVLPEVYLPYAKNRICLIGGYDSFGAQPGGQLIAYDNGLGSIIGDANGSVNYDTGEIDFEWNAVPPPVTYTTFYGRLLQPPDGVRKQFTYEVRTLPGGGGSTISLQLQNGIGRSLFKLSQLSSPSIEFENAWDNWNGNLNGNSLDQNESSDVVYENLSGFSSGTLNLKYAPEALVGQDFEIQVSPVTILVYSAFSTFVQQGGDYFKYIFADHAGRLYRDIAESYPTAQLDHLSGRYKGMLTTPSAIGRPLHVSYDSFMRSDSQDLKLPHDVMAAFGSVTMEEVF